MSPAAASRHSALLTLGLWAGIAAAAVVPGAVPIAAEAADVQPAVGHRAPDLTLKDVTGRPVRLSQVLAQKAVLLNFWAKVVQQSTLIGFKGRAERLRSIGQTEPGALRKGFEASR